jgi:hypothetical protein
LYDAYSLVDMMLPLSRNGLERTNKKTLKAVAIRLARVGDEGVM